MKNIRIDKKYIVIMLLVLVVGIGTITFAYFQGSVLNDLINPTGVSTGKIDVTISDASVNVSNIEPVLTNNVNFDVVPFVKKFTVTNGADTLNTCIELYLKISSISNGLVNTYFRYAVVNDDTGTTLTGNFDGASNGTELDLGSLYFFEKDTVKNYTMYVWIEYSPDVDQTSMLNSQMKASLFVKAQDTKTKDACDTRTTFNVTYVLDGGSGCSKGEIDTTDPNSKLCTPTSNTEGAVFGGWYSDEGLTKKISSIDQITDDMKLYASWGCTYDGTLTEGTEYVFGQYKYVYKQIYEITRLQGVQLIKRPLSGDGWSVGLADRNSTEPVSGPICKSIAGKKVVSIASAYAKSKASSIDLTGIDTSSFTDMSNMFYNAAAASINVSSLNTSNVTDMEWMFMGSKATSLDLSSFDTSKVTDMGGMFYTSKVTVLDLSSFTLNSSVRLDRMFDSVAATVGYAKDSATAAKFNASSSKPSTLVFTVK